MLMMCDHQCAWQGWNAAPVKAARGYHGILMRINTIIINGSGMMSKRHSVSGLDRSSRDQETANLSCSMAHK